MKSGEKRVGCNKEKSLQLKINVVVTVSTIPTLKNSSTIHSSGMKFAGQQKKEIIFLK